MMYKGDGLELRTPAGRVSTRNKPPSASDGWLSRALDDAAAAPALTVDEIVLRVCNQAFDLAVAHRAAEVDLEHLIHALTLVEPASAILHEYNFHVSTLRRESASIIASDPPAGGGAGNLAPSPSAEFAELLQFAAERAYSRRSPVTIEDLLDTLLDMKREHSSRNLLSRHRQDWDLRSTVDPEHRERVRVSAGSHPMGGVRAETVPTQTDTVQNTRIDALERAVRELSDDLSLNRKTFQTLIEEIRGGRASSGAGLYVSNGNGYGHAQPENAPEALDLDHDHIIDRLHLLERNVNTKFGELARTWTVLGDRLDALEQAVVELPDSKSGVPEGLTAVPERLSAIEALLEKVPAATSEHGEIVARLEPAVISLPERLVAMEQRILERAKPELPVELNQKLERIDAAFGALLSRLDDLEQRFEQPVAANWDAAPLAQGIKEIDSRTGDTQLMVDGLDDRVQKIESVLDAQRAQLAQMSSTLGTEIKAVASAVSAQSAGGERASSLLQDGVRNLLQVAETQQNGVATAISRELSDRMTALTAMIQSRHTEQNQLLGALSGRLEALEGAAGGDGSTAAVERISALADNFDRESQTAHDALTKINHNQQTLAQAMDRWQQQARADVVALNTRLGAIEASRQAAGPELQELTNRIEEMRGTLAERRMDSWTRFRIWLYGTDDWYGASWGDRHRNGAKQPNL
ncbi:MAG: hypothetical protein KDJ36_13145 [Hyphomicrobiaceae bacterium]|nr:hypothetical protein [Hyphomicrobiaceae bacterium]